MSKTSFTAFCVEFYANHVGKTGPEVYAEFEKSGLLRELDEGYGDLHGESHRQTSVPKKLRGVQCVSTT